MQPATGFEDIQTTEIVVKPGYARGLPVPWWLKLGAKVLLSRLPVSYRTWARLGLFRHGRTDVDLARAINGARKYIEAAAALSGRAPRAVVEIGPGDSAARGVVAAALGVERSYLIDAGDFAESDPAHYRGVAEALAAAGLPVPDLAGASSRDEILERCNARYLVEGAASFAEIADRSVDLVFSQVVMEHLPYAEFDRFLAETQRVLRPGGLAMHSVDLHDHLGGKLESLRFSQRLWESHFMRDSGFYTNRLRYPEIIARCAAQGFEVKVTRILRWPRLPTARRSLDSRFTRLSDRDLSVCAFDLVLRNPPELA